MRIRQRTKFGHLIRFICLLILLVISAVALAGCSRSNDSGPVVISEFSEELDEFIPDLPASWIYNGTAEYSHVMSLGEVYETAGQKIYRVYGEVEDMTDGDFNADFRFELGYIVSGDMIEQTKSGQMIMDSEYERITLLKLPLEVGNTWTDELVSPNGKKVKVKGTIESIEKESSGRSEGGNGDIYTVKYEESGSKYYEIRKIQKGSGVISFEKVIFYDGDEFVVQYDLFELDRDSTLIAKNKDEPSDSIAKNSDPFGEGTLIELDTIPKQVEGVVPDESLKAELTSLIQEFNGAWTLFANDKNMGILDYVTDDGEAFDIIHRFPAGTMILSFELIDVGEIRVDDDRANIYVHEIIKKVTDEKTEMLEYFWLYETRYIDGKWYIHSYVNQ